MSAWTIPVTKLELYGGAVRPVVAMLRAVRFESIWCVPVKLLGRKLIGCVLGIKQLEASNGLYVKISTSCMRCM